MKLRWDKKKLILHFFCLFVFNWSLFFTSLVRSISIFHPNDLFLSYRYLQVLPKSLHSSQFSITLLYILALPKSLHSSFFSILSLSYIRAIPKSLSFLSILYHSYTYELYINLYILTHPLSLSYILGYTYFAFSLIYPLSLLYIRAIPKSLHSYLSSIFLLHIRALPNYLSFFLYSTSVPFTAPSSN